MSKGKPAGYYPNIIHAHAAPPVTCPNCGYSSQGYTTTASGQAGSHTHGVPVLDQKVVNEFAKPDPDPDLNEWRKQHIG